MHVAVEAPKDLDDDAVGEAEEVAVQLARAVMADVEDDQVRRRLRIRGRRGDGRRGFCVEGKRAAAPAAPRETSGREGR